MAFNPDELDAPKWVNAGFMKTVIETSGRGEDVQIQDFKVTPGTAFGDHFASIMFRLQAGFTSKGKSNQKISVIVKTFPVEEGLKKDVLTKMNVFEAEIFMYTKVLKDCEETLRKCGYTERFAPELLYHALEPVQVLVFEDLKELDYYMMEKNFPSEHEIRLVYSKLAQYHATTFKMLAEGRDDLDIKGTMFALPFIKDSDLYRSAPLLLGEVLYNLPGNEFAKQMTELDFDSFLERCKDIVADSPPYKVLNHGDYHLRNMMFKKNGFGAVSEVILLDFQIPHCGSPAYDLIYMAIALPYKSREKAFRHYFNVFSDVLVKSGFKDEMPTYEQLQEEIKRFAPIDLFLSMTVSLFVHLDMDEFREVGSEQFMKDINVRRRFYKTPSYIKHMHEVVPQLLKQMNDEKTK